MSWWLRWVRIRPETARVVCPSATRDEETSLDQSRGVAPYNKHVREEPRERCAETPRPLRAATAVLRGDSGDI